MNRNLLLVCPLLFLSLFRIDLPALRVGQERSSDPFKNGFYSAEIRQHNGAPTLFLDGQPAFYRTWWVSPPTVEGWAASEIAGKNAAETGIHIYAFDVGSME
ncbi:hypothetical protein D4R75_14910 [bacterium]|nr:MAG: hypothetical protein D4R75_14910 [bacterium]